MIINMNPASNLHSVTIQRNFEIFYVRNGRSGDDGLLQEWPEGGPPLAWKSSGLGGGYSSVSVAGDRVFTMPFSRSVDRTAFQSQMP